MHDNAFYKSIWFMILVSFFGLLFFCYKTDSCGMGSGCHETIKDPKSSPFTTPTCDVGATIEKLSSGEIACHCSKVEEKK